MDELRQGLEGVVVCETRLSEVNGELGRLVILGLSIQDAAKLGYAGLAGRFLGASTADCERRLAEGRDWAAEQVARLGDVLRAPDAMDCLRGSIAQLADEDPLYIAAAVSVFGGAWSRTHRGLAPVSPDPKRKHAEDHLRMITGADPSPNEQSAMDTYLATVMDHGMNASTFAARVVASTDSDRVSSIVAGLGALKGPLHGGAPGPVLDMLDSIGSAERASEWVRNELQSGNRIMGMGHRVYKVRDPRAAVLEDSVNRLSAAANPRLALAREVERIAEGLLKERYPTRSLRANVEFYTAILLEALGIPREMFTATFAAGRVVGWCAHIDEQKKTGRLIRPRSRYVGVVPN